ncbi:MAG: ABC transporter ATP-binding protein/permease [Acidimicrobiia bacterium]|nr:ABC transporter ATP-binding protein/permease [Acidimicrobiia bacterium]
MIGIFVALGWTFARIAIPWLVQKAIDSGIEGDGSLLSWVAIITAAGVVSGIFTGLRRYWAFRNARRVEARLRDRLFAHVQRLHFAFHDSVQTGDLMSRANTDLQHFQNFITMLPVTAGNVVVVGAVTVLLFTEQAGLAFLALLFLPLVNVLGRRFGQRLHPAVMGIQTEAAELASVVEETIAGVRVVKGFGAERLQAERLATEADDVYDQSMRASTVRSIYLPAVELMPSIGLILVLWRGGQLVMQGQLTVGELVSFNIYVAMLIQPLRMLGMIIASGQRASAAGQRIHGVLATAPNIVDPARPVELPSTYRPAEPAGGATPSDGAAPPPTGAERGHVRFSDVSFGYPDEPEVAVLHDLDLEIEPGDTVALVGSTGSGKSTIAQLLPRFYDVTAGSIALDGIDVRNIRRQELRRAVGIVFEETFLFSASIADNIAFADPSAPPEKIEYAARLAGAHDFIVELDQGYDTLLGERGYSLSGGQRQRIAIARAVLANPRVVILDDATSAVDPTKEHEIRDALTDVMGRRTTIVIAHRPATVALADRVVLLDEGRIVAEGRHAQLLATNARYREVLAAAELGPPEPQPRGDGGSAPAAEAGVD